MKGKRTEIATWIREFLKAKNIDTSNWEAYMREYNFYAARVRKYNPENYGQFINTCTFPKQGSKGPSCPRIPEEKPFNEEKWYKAQKKEWEDWKARMQRYRDGLIRNQEQQGETGRARDFMPYLFKYALRCLSGEIPEECFPERLNEYRKELQNILDEQRKEFRICPLRKQ